MKIDHEVIKKALATCGFPEHGYLRELAGKGKTERCIRLSAILNVPILCHNHATQQHVAYRVCDFNCREKLKAPAPTTWDGGHMFTGRKDFNIIIDACELFDISDLHYIRGELACRKVINIIAQTRRI